MLDRRNLPTVVLERIDKEPASGVATRLRANVEEERIARVEFRRTETGVVTIEGYASTFNTPYDVAGGAPYGWTELVEPGAFTRALSEKDDVRLLFNHEGQPLARSKAGSLRLTEDSIGLRVEADLRQTALAKDITLLLEGGELDEMSFAFRTMQQAWNDDYTERRIQSVRLFDVSIVTYPANRATAVQLRSEQPGMSLSIARAIAAL